MIITSTCDLCDHLNDNNNGPCRHCGGQTEERCVRGKWVTVAVKRPTITLHGYYNPKVREAFAETQESKP